MTMLERLRRRMLRAAPEPTADRPMSDYDMSLFFGERRTNEPPIRPEVASVITHTATRQALQAQAWADAIAALPAALRAKLDSIRQDIATTDQELQRARNALETMRSPSDAASRQNWLVERAALQQHIAQLSALRPEQATTYVQLARTAADYIRAAARKQAETAQQATVAAAAAREAALRQHTALLNQAQATETAINEVMSATVHPHLVEAQFGCQITPDPKIAERAAMLAERAEREQITLLLHS